MVRKQSLARPIAQMLFDEAAPAKADAAAHDDAHRLIR